MANVYGVDGAAVVTLLLAPNLNRIPFVTEDEFVDADVNHEIGHLALAGVQAVAASDRWCGY